MRVLTHEQTQNVSGAGFSEDMMTAAATMYVASSIFSVGASAAAISISPLMTLASSSQPALVVVGLTSTMLAPIAIIGGGAACVYAASKAYDHYHDGVIGNTVNNLLKR